MIMYKDVCGLAQAKGLPSLIYHEPVLEVRFMRGAAGTFNSSGCHSFNELVAAKDTGVLREIDSESKAARVCFVESEDNFTILSYLECHQIVTISGAKRTKTKQRKKI